MLVLIRPDVPRKFVREVLGFIQRVGNLRATAQLLVLSRLRTFVKAAMVVDPVPAAFHVLSLPLG